MKYKISIIEKYYMMYSDVIAKIEHKKYKYTDLDGFFNIFVDGISKNDIRLSEKIYWQEILQRVHFASIISLIRSEKWLSGVLFGIKHENLLVFSASLRGFLESTVDSYYSLESLPTSLALNFKMINSAVKGELNQMFLCEEIENKLIHFQFAKRDKQGQHPPNHTALTNSKYIEAFDLEKIGIKNLYSKLCEITHPAADSISCFTKTIHVSENYSYMTTNEKEDSKIIINISNNFSEQIEILLKLGFTLYCLCLKILSKFDYDAVNADFINETIYEKIINKKAWNNILAMIQNSRDSVSNDN